MSYTTYDFEESIQRVGLAPSDIAAVVSAWGAGDGQGDDAGHWKWSPHDVTDWAGGFLMRLRDGRFGYLTGWCDYTGWGCRDGATLYHFDHEPTRDDILKATSGEYSSPPADSEWDHEPADLNRWLKSHDAGSIPPQGKD